MKTLLEHQGLYFAAALLLSIGLTGCGGGGKKGGLPITDAQPYDTIGGPGSLSDLDPGEWGTPDEVANASARPVYFGYDSTQVAGSEYSKLQNIVTLLRQDPGRKLKIEGHCDERGSREYNLARNNLMEISIEVNRDQTL